MNTKSHCEKSHWEKSNWEKTDAVIVLANLMDVNGALNFESAARAGRSVEFLIQQKVNNLVTCGWAYRTDSKINIADAFKDHIASKYNVLPGMVISEKNSRDTVGDAYFTKINLAKPRGWRRVCVVTSNYHVERSREIFCFIYGDEFRIDVIGADVPCNDEIIRNELKSMEAFRNTFAGVESGNDAMILDRLRNRHPFYNGEFYPQI